MENGEWRAKKKVQEAAKKKTQKIVIKSKEIQDNEPDFNYLFFHTH